MHLETPAIICAVLPHGEHGAVVRFLTPADALIAGYVRRPPTTGSAGT
jgi:DNA repair protein RecO (recombination protein O)